MGDRAEQLELRALVVEGDQVARAAAESLPLLGSGVPAPGTSFACSRKVPVLVGRITIEIFSVLPDATGFPRITAGLLERGYSANAIRKILGENHLRVLRQTLDNE